MSKRDLLHAALARRFARTRVPVMVDDHARQEAYDEAYFDVMEGRASPFWPTREWASATDGPLFDNEQEIRLFNAVKLAVSLVGASDTDRWLVIENALRVEAEIFANYVASQIKE